MLHVLWKFCRPQKHGIAELSVAHTCTWGENAQLGMTLWLTSVVCLLRYIKTTLFLVEPRQSVPETTSSGYVPQEVLNPHNNVYMYVYPMTLWPWEDSPHQGTQPCTVCARNKVHQGSIIILYVFTIIVPMQGMSLSDCISNGQADKHTYCELQELAVVYFWVWVYRNVKDHTRKCRLCTI